MSIYTTPRCTCIICHKEYSSKGIDTHYTITHTTAGQLVHIKKMENRKAAGFEKTRELGRADVAANTAEYLKAPTSCKQCNTVMAYAERHNSFCSRSCSATNVNSVRKGVHLIPRHQCAQCDNMTLTKYCSRACCSAGITKQFASPEEKLAYRRSRVREVSANYRANLKNQTPLDADRAAIKQFYSQCEPGYEVDHIIPISKGGLHTLSNLQYLTVSENRAKGSKLNWSK